MEAQAVAVENLEGTSVTKAPIGMRVRIAAKPQPVGRQGQILAHAGLGDATGNNSDRRHESALLRSRLDSCGFACPTQSTAPAGLWCLGLTSFLTLHTPNPLAPPSKLTSALGQLDV